MSAFGGKQPVNREPMARVRVGGVAFDQSAPDTAVSHVLADARSGGERHHVHFVNAYSVALASGDSGLANVYSDSRAMVFADGKSVSIVSRIGRGGRLEQVRGPSFFRACLAETSAATKHYFLGSTPEVLAALLETIRKEYPNVVIAGAYSPPFVPLSADSIADMAEAVAGTDASIVWVGLGTPKQDYVAMELQRKMGRTTVAVGAAFDFVAGSLSEAPPLLRRSGLEWLYRFWQEPRRLWKRYTLGNAQFAYLVLRDALRRP